MSLEMNTERIMQYEDRLREIAKSDDPESAHVYADRLIVELLLELGFDKFVAIYSGMEKWYS